jgi:hypothetical protein
VQNRYVGDLGDFGKYGLLRHLCSQLVLGVVWYLVPDEGHNRDGRHIRYLNLDAASSSYYGVPVCTPEAAAHNVRDFRRCQPELYDSLARIIAARARTVAEVRARGLLPRGSVFSEEPLTFIASTPLPERHRAREAWLSRAMAQTADCDIVFLDPDNGLEVKSHPITSRLGPKYAAYDDLKRFRARDQTVIIYQHFERTSDFLARRRKELVSQLGLADDEVYCVHYRRGTARAYFIIPAAPACFTSRRTDTVVPCQPLGSTFQQRVIDVAKSVGALAKERGGPSLRGR